VKTNVVESGDTFVLGLDFGGAVGSSVGSVDERLSLGRDGRSGVGDSSSDGSQ